MNREVTHTMRWVRQSIACCALGLLPLFVAACESVSSMGGPAGGLLLPQNTIGLIIINDIANPVRVDALFEFRDADVRRSSLFLAADGANARSETLATPSDILTLEVIEPFTLAAARAGDVLGSRRLVRGIDFEDGDVLTFLVSDLIGPVPPFADAGADPTGLSDAEEPPDGSGPPSGVDGADCNNNEIPDSDDIANGSSQDCNSKPTPDECEVDCDTNGLPDDCDQFADCNTNSFPDACDLVEPSADCNFNNTPDECEVDCDTNGLPDDCDESDDCNTNQVPDACDVAGQSADSNSNGTPDECEPQDRGPHLDIKPGSCPNSFNRSSRGVLPVGLLGDVDFDVSDVDQSSLRLTRADGIGGSVAPNEGPPGPHTNMQDVGTPFDGELCDCHDASIDGIEDLSMHFRTEQVVDVLQLNALDNGAVIELVLVGTLNDGTPFMASDCIRLVPAGVPPGMVTVQAGEPDMWIDSAPWDDQLDGGGFTEFERTHLQGTLVTLTAPPSSGNIVFDCWLLDGQMMQSGQVTIQFPGNDTAHIATAVYR